MWRIVAEMRAERTGMSVPGSDFGGLGAEYVMIAGLFVSLVLGLATAGVWAGVKRSLRVLLWSPAFGVAWFILLWMVLS